MSFDVAWVSAFRDAEHPADPAYPNGKAVVAVKDQRAPTCHLDLPYPAKCVGQFVVKCRVCGLTTMVTAAGRADDPRSLTINCLSEDPHGEA